MNKPSAPPATARQHSFAQKLPDDSPAARPEGKTQGDFLGAIRPARQQHVGQVKTGDEQHRAGHRKKQGAD